MKNPEVAIQQPITSSSTSNNKRTNLGPLAHNTNVIVLEDITYIHHDGDAGLSPPHRLSTTQRDGDEFEELLELRLRPSVSLSVAGPSISSQADHNPILQTKSNNMLTVSSTHLDPNAGGDEGSASLMVLGGDDDNTKTSPACPSQEAIIEVDEDIGSWARERDKEPLLIKSGVGGLAADVRVYSAIPCSDGTGEITTGAGTEGVSQFRSRLLEAVKRLWGNGRYALGIILILCVAVIWVAASVWIQYIFGDFNYNKPYFLTFFNTCGFSGWNLGFLFSSSWREVPRVPETEDGDLLLDKEDSCSDGEDSVKDDGDGDDDRGSAAITSNNDTTPAASTLTSPTTTTTRESNSSAPGGTLSEFPVGSVLEDVVCASQRDPLESPPSTTHQEMGNAAKKHYSLRRLAKSALLFCPLWFGANCLFNYSLSTTSVASNTILSTTSSIWTMIFSYFLLGQPILRAHKIAAVVLCIGGSVLVALSDDDSGSSGNHHPAANHTAISLPAVPFEHRAFLPSLAILNRQERQLYRFNAAQAGQQATPPRRWAAGVPPHNSTSFEYFPPTQSRFFINEAPQRGRSNTDPSLLDGNSQLPTVSQGTRTIIGDLLALLSAVFYGAYTTTLKWCLPNEARYSMGMVFGFVGVANALLMWPGLLLVDATGIEPFELPPTWFVFGALALNAAVGTNLSDVLWAKSVVLTSPLVATLGLSMTIPVALVYDLVIKQSPFSGMYLGGAALVVLGFVVSTVRS